MAATPFPEGIPVSAATATPSSFELWDGELGVSLGVFGSEAEALAEVRRLCMMSAGSRAPLGLVQDGKVVLATGEALAERALGKASPA